MDGNEMYMKLSDKLDKIIEKIDSKLCNLDTKIQNHETRLVVLEVHDKNDSSDWKSQLLMLLAKSLIICAAAVAGLAGVGGIISKLVGV